MVQTLAMVALQERLRAAHPRDEERQSPGKGSGVAEPGIEALADEWWHEVERIAGQHDPVDERFVCPPCFECVDDLPFQVAVYLRGSSGRLGRVHQKKDRELTLSKPQGSRSRHIFSSWSKDSLLSPGNRMNSNLLRPGPPNTHVVGRLGSQICAVPSLSTTGGTYPSRRS
jgi:hypothetical protein